MRYFLDTVSDTWAYQSWRAFSGMMDEAARLLRNGLYAKALFYKTKWEYCELVLPFPDVCGSSIDFTSSAKNALIWVDAYFQGVNSNSFA